MQSKIGKKVLRLINEELRCIETHKEKNFLVKLARGRKHLKILLKLKSWLKHFKLS